MAGTQNSPSLSQGRAMGRQVVALLRGYVERSLSTVHTKIEALQKQVAEAPGRDAVRAEVERAVKRAALSFEPGTVSSEALRPMIEAEMLRWQVEFERRASDVLDRAVSRIPAPRDGVDGAPGRDGVDGANGRDGFSLENFSVGSSDFGRTLCFTFRDASGAEAKSTIKTAVVIDQGVYENGRTYDKGDGVTFGGSFWIAQSDTKEKPGSSPDWRLSVKKGRDGKDAGGAA